MGRGSGVFSLPVSNVFLAEIGKWRKVMGVNVQKNNLRRRIMRDLNHYSRDEMMRHSLSGQRLLTALLNREKNRRGRKALKVALFAARSHELDFLQLVNLMPEIEWYFPECGMNREMVFRRVTDIHEDFVLGYSHIREPRHDLPAVDPHDLDVVVTPGAAFSLDGKRLGSGGGFYDVLFSKGLEAVKVGICLSCQLYDEIPTEPHDFLMDDVLVVNKRHS